MRDARGRCDYIRTEVSDPLQDKAIIDDIALSPLSSYSYSARIFICVFGIIMFVVEILIQVALDVVEFHCLISLQEICQIRSATTTTTSGLIWTC